MIKNQKTEYSSWCSPATFIPKMAVGLKLVTDFTRLNRFIDRPVHPFPTTEQIQQSIHPSSRYFAKVDLVSAYHQIPLAVEDQGLTTFLLPWGRFFYTHTPMGLAPSGDYACQITDQAVDGIRNVVKSVDEALLQDTGAGPRAVIATLEEVFMSFRKHGIIASSKSYASGLTFVML